MLKWKIDGYKSRAIHKKRWFVIICDVTDHYARTEVPAKKTSIDPKFLGQGERKKLM